MIYTDMTVYTCYCYRIILVKVYYPKYHRLKDIGTEQIQSNILT